MSASAGREGVMQVDPNDLQALRQERSRLVELIETLELSRLHARDAGATESRVGDLKHKVAELDRTLDGSTPPPMT